MGGGKVVDEDCSTCYTWCVAVAVAVAAVVVVVCFSWVWLLSMPVYANTGTRCLVQG